MGAFTATMFREAMVSFAAGEIDWASDALYLQLHTGTMNPNLDTWRYQSSLTNEVSSSGTGYTTGGVQLADAAATYTKAADLTAWSGGQTWALGQFRRPSTPNGYCYQCVVAGAGHAETEPTWPTTVGLTVADSAATWLCAGKGVLKLSASDPTPWSSATFTFRYGVIVDTTPASAAANPLIVLLDAGGDQVASAGTVTVTWNANGILEFAV
jgi:hypothetical protein